MDLSGDSAFFGGYIDVDGEHMDGLLMLGGGVLGADILIVEDIPNDDVNNISFDFNGSVGLDNPGLITGTNYLVANALTQFFGPIRIHTSGDIEVLAELDFSDSFVPELRLHAGQQLTVNAAIVMAFSTHDSSWRWAFTMFLGFAVEVIGVTTGLLFGEYSYGTGSVSYTHLTLPTTR